MTANSAMWTVAVVVQIVLAPLAGLAVASPWTDARLRDGVGDARCGHSLIAH